MSGPDPAASDVDASSTPHESEPVGSVAQEAFKLFRAMTSQDPGASSGSDHAAHDHVCSTTWCPVCQVVGFARDNPDAIASVKRSAVDLARSLRDLVDTALAPEEKK